jgi:hypothetical protein
MLNSSTTRGFIMVILLVSASNVMSEGISYDYVQGSYVSTSMDSGTTEGDVDGNGYGFLASLSITPNYAFTVVLVATAFDTFQSVDTDTTDLAFGVTAHTSVSTGTDIFGNFSVLVAKVETTDGINPISDDDTGYVISIGLRHLVTDALELEAGASREDVFEDTSNSFGVTARFYVSETFSLGVGYATGDDVDSLLLNARLNM